MGQVSIADISTGSANANTTDVTHIVAAGEGLIVGVLLEVTDDTKEVDNIAWDPGGDNQALTFFSAFSPTHGKLRLEVWRHTGPNAGTQTITVTIEGGNSQITGVAAISVTNMDLTTPLGGAATDEDTSTSGSVSVSQDVDSLAFCFAGHLQNADAYTVGGGENEHADFDVGAHTR